MEVNVSRERLFDCLQAVMGVVPQRSPKPVLTNVFLELKDNKLVLFGTDFDLSLVGELEPIEVIEEGRLGVSGRRFFDLIRELTSDEINLKTEGKRLIVKESRSGGRFSFPVVGEEDFPLIPKIETEKFRFKTESSLLLEMLSRTSYAASPDISLISFTGILWQIRPNEFRTVATDGHRLALAYGERSAVDNLEFDLLIPKRSVEQLMKLLAKTGVKEFETVVADGRVFFHIGSFTFISSLIAEKFPNYEQVIPRDNDKILVVQRDELVQALRRVGLFSSTLTHLVRFLMDENGLRLKSGDPEAGDAIQPVSANYEGEPLEVGFNSNDITEILRHIETDSVKFAFRSQVTACVIYPLVDEPKYFTVVMPLRLPEE